MEKVYCVHCGAALDVYARFCRNCGEKTPISPAMIRLAMDKDQQAICELYERTYQDVYHTIKSVVHDEDTALDILQDAYIKGFESLGQLNDPRSFLPWMKRIAINRAKNELKRKKPMLFTDMENEDGDELPFQDEREEHLPDIVIDKQETTRLINEMLATLSEEQRMVIGMFYYEQMSVKEIAAELGCSENTVKSRLNYGRKKIETQVLDLEKRGTKLYSLSPVLFLLLLFRNVAGQTADIPAQQILSNIQGSVAAQTAAQAGSAAGQEAARTGAKAADEAAKQGFLHTVAGKVVAGIAAVALIGGAVGGAVQLAQNNIAEAEPVNAAVETETAAEQDAALEQTEEITHGEEIVPDVQPEEPEVNSTELAMEAYTEYLESVLIPEKGILETEQSGVKSFPDMPAEEPPYDELPEMLVVYGNANAGISLDLYDTEDEAVVLKSTVELKNVLFDGYQGYVDPLVLWRQDADGVPHLVFWYNDDVAFMDAPGGRRTLYVISCEDGELAYEYGLCESVATEVGYGLVEYTYESGNETSRVLRDFNDSIMSGTAEDLRIAAWPLDYSLAMAEPLAEHGIVVNQDFELTGENATLIFRNAFADSGDYYTASMDFADNTAFHQTYEETETVSQQTDAANTPGWRQAYAELIPTVTGLIEDDIGDVLDDEKVVCKYMLLDMTQDGTPELIISTTLFFGYPLGTEFIYVFSYDGNGAYLVDSNSYVSVAYQSEATGSLLVCGDASRMQGLASYYAVGLENGVLNQTVIAEDVHLIEEGIEDHLDNYPDYSEIDWYAVDDFDGTLPY